MVKVNFKKISSALYGFGSVDLGGAGIFGKLTTINAIANFALILIFRIGIVTALFFTIMAGVKFAISKGDPGKFNEAKDTIINVLIGLVLLIGVISIINLALRIIGINTSIIEILKQN